MQVGDLVRYIDGIVKDRWPEAGVVTRVHPWVDPGAPDRNFGVTIGVFWPDGAVADHDECELEVISEGR